MRLAQLSTRFPPAPGGVERHVFEVARRQVDRGESVEVYTSELYTEYPMVRLPPEVRREERGAAGPVHRLPVWSLPGELHYPFFRGLDRALRTDPPEIVHAHTFGTNHVAAARRLHRRRGIPFVLTAHFHPIWSIEGGWLRHRIRGFYDRRMAGPIVGDAQRLIVQTHEEERLLRSLGIVLPPVRIIPPGYTPLPAPAEGDTPFARRFGVPGPFVLFVGRLASNKGLLPLVDAFETFARSEPTASLVLVGEDGGMRVRVEQRIRERNLEGRVILTGHLADEHLLAAAFQEARLCVLPSEYEAFGLVLLEALAQGTPVVASRVGGIPEVVEHGKSGLLVPPNDPLALAAAFSELWGDETRRRSMGAYGRNEVVPRYTWDGVVDALRQVYAEALDR